MNDQNAESWERMQELIENKDADGLLTYLKQLPVSDISWAMAHLDEEARSELIESVSHEEAASILQNITEDQAADVIETIDAKEAASKGDFATAIKLAKRAKFESDAAYAQGESQKDAKSWLL